MDSAVKDWIGIAGTGRVAQALGRLLVERGQPVAALAGRDPERAAAAAGFVGTEAFPLEELPKRVSRVLVAVADRALTAVARRLAEAGMRGGIALHTCGAHGPEALAPLAEQGVSCGALHPLQTFATPERGLAALPGAAFGITAEGAAARWAEQIVALLGGRPLPIPADRRPLYHAAAVLASNAVVALADAAVILMSAAGAPADAALQALAPLLRASCENALTLGPVSALTGPVERGDLETVALHRHALAAAPPTVRELYRAASLHLVEIARRRGLSAQAAERLEALLRS